MAVALLVVVCALLALLATTGPAKRHGSVRAGARSASSPRPQHSPSPLVARRLPFTLPAAEQDGAGVPLGGARAALLGGLDAADTSLATVTVLDARGILAATARLPEAQHDAQAALLAGHAYVFGGGQFSSYDHILAVDPATLEVTQVGSLPTPTSDAAVAALAGTAYIVGGYDGQRALDTIVAWRPGERPQVVGRLPFGLRYAAVAASDRRILIAGGSRGEVASTAILSYDPVTHEIKHIGELPHPVTHAVAVALGGFVYIVGGRGSAPGTQTASIVAVDPVSGRAVSAGRLPRALSDAAAVPLGAREVLLGGMDASGPVASVQELALGER